VKITKPETNFEFRIAGIPELFFDKSANNEVCGLFFTPNFVRNRSLKIEKGQVFVFVFSCFI